jgi:hypothetical protein
LEQLHSALVENPQRFARLLDASLNETDIEKLNGEVATFLDAATSDHQVGKACSDMRAAWPNGHAAVANALQDLQGAVEEAGLHPSRVAWTTIVSRLLGPGSHSSLPHVARELLSRWDQWETSVGVELDARTFGALCHAEAWVDTAFRLGTDTEPSKRSRVISNLFWPRGSAASRLDADVANPFGLMPSVDRAMVRESLDPGPEPIEVEHWDDSARKRVAQCLIDEGSAVLQFKGVPGRLAREVALSLQQEPIDVGAILVYPDIVGVTQSNAATLVTIVLPVAS